MLVTTLVLPPELPVGLGMSVFSGAGHGDYQFTVHTRMSVLVTWAGVENSRKLLEIS